MKITFKATDETSLSCDGYRGIDKSGDLKFDMTADSDDAIILYTKEHRRITIDSDKETGAFSLKFNEKDFLTFE